jgi:hypothetical protein
MAAWAITRCLRHPAASDVAAVCKSVQELEGNVAVSNLALVHGDHPGKTPQQAGFPLGKPVTWPTAPLPLAAVVRCSAMCSHDGPVLGHADRVAATVGHRDRLRPRAGRPPGRGHRRMRLATPGPHGPGGVALPPVAELAEIDRLVSASISGGQPLYRLDTDAIGDLRPDLVLSQDLCAVCAVPPATSPKPWTSWAARPRWCPWTPAPWTRSWTACSRSARPPAPSSEPTRSSRTARAARRRPGRGRGAPAAPGVRAGVGRSAVQRWPLGAGHAAGRRRRGAACLSGCPVGAGELGADRGGGGAGGGVHALRLWPPGGRRRGEAVLPGAPRAGWCRGDRRRRCQRLLLSSGSAAGRRCRDPRRRTPPRTAAPATSRNYRATRAETAPVGPSSRWHDKEP